MILVRANITYRMKRNRSINHDSIQYAGSADNKRVKITTTPNNERVNNPDNLLDDEMEYTYTSDANYDTNDASEGQVSNNQPTVKDLHEEPTSIFSLPAELRQMILIESFRGNEKRVYDPWSFRRLNSMIAEWVAILTEMHPNLREDVVYIEAQWLKISPRKEDTMDPEKTSEERKSIITAFGSFRDQIIEFHMRIEGKSNALDWWNCNMVADEDLLRATEKFPSVR